MTDGPHHDLEPSPGPTSKPPLPTEMPATALPSNPPLADPSPAVDAVPPSAVSTAPVLPSAVLPSAVPPPANLAGDDPDDGWRRVHWMTLGFEFLSAARQIIIGLVILRFDFFALGAAGGPSLGPLPLLEVLAVVLPLGGAVIRWFTTRYAIDDDTVRLRQGLLRRRRDAMPRANVQNVSASTTALGRIVGLSQLQVSDASGGDLTIRYIESGEVERLSALLRTGAGRLHASTQPAPAATSTGAVPGGGRPDGDLAPAAMGASPGNGQPVTEVLEADLTIGTPVVAPPFARVLLGRLGVSLTGLIGLLPGLLVVVCVAVAIGVRAGVDIGGFSSADLVRGASAAIAAGAGLGALPLLVVGGQTVLQSLALGNFRLWAGSDQFRIRTGVLSEQQLTAKHDRIQSVQVEHHVVLRAFGLERVRFQTADQELLGGSVTTFLSPGQTLGTWRHVTEMALGDLSPALGHLRQVSPLTMRRFVVRWGVLGALIAAALCAVWWPTALVFAPLWAIGAVLVSKRRFQRLGFAYDDRHLVLRSGVLAEELLVLDLDKVQVVRSVANPFQRRLGLASVVIVAAGVGSRGVAFVPDLPTAEAAALVAEMAQRSAGATVSKII